MAGFQGWPEEALVFLRELEANNDREWFRANKARYDALLVAPAKLLAEDLSRFGAAQLFRPYRDTRFHPGPPIKELISFKLGDPGAGGGYVELSLDGVVVGAGVYMTGPDQVERWRAAVDDGRKAAALAQALAKAAAAGMTLGEPALKRVPRGFPADHPRGELLRHRRFAVMHREGKPGRWLHTTECGERIAAKLDAARPFVRWLGEHIGPSRRA